jgi:hypothetical protein
MNNCGRCNHPCQGAACSGSLCAPIILASGENNPAAIAVDATNVYWANQVNAGTIKECLIGGCGGAGITLVTGQFQPSAIAAKSGNVYWTTSDDGQGNGGQVIECGAANATVCNSSLLVLANTLQSPQGITADLVPFVYFTQRAPGTPGFGPPGDAVEDCAINGCSLSPTPIALTQNDPYGVAVDSTNVYWADNGGGSVMKCVNSACNGTQVALATGQGNPGARIAVDATNVYWVNSSANTVVRCAIAGCSNNPTVLATDSVAGSTAGFLALDSTAVYWTNRNDNTVKKCALTGCGGVGTIIASQQNSPADIAVDGTSVYWTNQVNSVGSVMKVAK